MAIQNPGFETAGAAPGEAANWSLDPKFNGTSCGRMTPANWPVLPEGTKAMVLGSDNLAESQTVISAQRNFTAGTGTAGITDSFHGWVPKDPAARVQAGTVEVKRDGSTVVATDNGLGVIAGVGVAGTIDYATGEYTVAEVATQVWNTGQVCGIYFYEQNTDTRLQFTEQYVNFGADNYQKFRKRNVTPSDLEGATWISRLRIDGVVVWEKTYTTGGENLTEDDVIAVPVSGAQWIRFEEWFVPALVGTLPFDDLSQTLETFDNWAGIIQFWVEAAANIGAFDAGVETKEVFENWVGTIVVWDEGTAVNMPFDAGAETKEVFENWLA